MSENRFGLPDSIVNPHWLAVWSGKDLRWPSEVEAIVAEHAGQPGAVLVFRYAPNRQIHSRPIGDWVHTVVQIDGQVLALVPRRGTEWVPLAAGRHRISVHKQRFIRLSELGPNPFKKRGTAAERLNQLAGPQLAAAEFDVDREPVVVAVTPRRSRGIFFVETTPRIDVGSPTNSAKTASTGEEHQ